MRVISGNRTGIIVQGFPHSEHVQQLRRTLHQYLAQCGLAHGPEATHLRHGAHSSLVVFAGPLRTPQPLANYIAAHRTTDYGNITISKVEVVRYVRSHLGVQIIPYTQATLRGRAYAMQ